MKITQSEQKAIRTVLEAGRQHGYGNMIAHLQTAWAEMLVRDYGFAEETARGATARDGRGYPFRMQADLLERGFWDETGAMHN